MCECPQGQRPTEMLAFFVGIHKGINAIMCMKQYYELGEILSLEECNSLAQEILSHKNSGHIVEETDTRFYNNSFGGNTPGSWEVLRRMTPKVEEVIGIKLKEENPYCRIYNNGSTLHNHVDREGLDWTISVCLFTNLKHDWPLYAIDGEEILSFPTKLNTACLMNGRKLEHWRAPLQCSNDEYVIQMFLHWSEVR